jgi:hypothetical protein
MIETIDEPVSRSGDEMQEIGQELEIYRRASSWTELNVSRTRF